MTQRVLKSAAFFLCAALCCNSAQAGAQKEEDLADSVRTALAAQISDAAPADPAFARYEERIAYLNWLGEMGNRLARLKPDFKQRTEFLKTVWYEARRAGLEPELVLGLIQVESNFRKHAISRAGAIGYMQVMPFWSKTIGNGDPRSLFDMRTNLRYGCTILRHYLDREKGDLYLALGRYNGSRGQAEYPKAVQAAWKRWELIGYKSAVR
jgi:soluble lytic murein transglycosylase-like protein